MVNQFEKNPQILPPPPPPPHPSFPSSEGDRGKEEGEITPEEGKLFELVSGYGEMSPEKVAMGPQLRATLQDLRERQLFVAQVYTEGSAAERGFAPAIHNPQTFNGRITSLIYDFVPEGQRRDAALDNLRRESEESGIHETVTYRPLSRFTFGKLVKNANQIHGSEHVVKITYMAYGNTSYQNSFVRNEVEKNIRRGRPSQLEVADKNILLADDIETRLNDSKAVRDYLRSSPGKHHRPSNQTAIGVILPQSVAEKLWTALQNQPESIRPFFIAGGLEYMDYHNPPPYKEWDQSQSNKIRMRNFSDSKTYQDKILTSQPTKKTS